MKGTAAQGAVSALGEHARGSALFYKRACPITSAHAPFLVPQSIIGVTRTSSMTKSSARRTREVARDTDS